MDHLGEDTQRIKIENCLNENINLNLFCVNDDIDTTKQFEKSPSKL